MFDHFDVMIKVTVDIVVDVIDKIMIDVRIEIIVCTDGNTVFGCESDKNSLVIIYMF